MERLISRERVVRALNHQETDRVPIDIGGISSYTSMHRDAYKKFQKHLKSEGETLTISSVLAQAVEVGDWIREKFHSDCYTVYITTPNANELNLKVDQDGATWFIDEWGIKWKCPVEGLYYDPVEPPLIGLTIEDLEKYPWPDPNSDKGIKEISEKVRSVFENTEYAVVCSGPLFGGIVLPTQQMIGYEEFYIKLLIEPNFVTYVMNKVVDYHIGQWGQVLDKCGDCIQVAIMNDNLGAQVDPLIDSNIYRELIKPLQKKVVDFIKSKAPHIKIIYHCDKSVRTYISDIIDIGFDACNSIEFITNEIDETTWLVKQYEDKICFWGGFYDCKNILSLSTPQEIKEEVGRKINDMGHGGGYVLASIYNIEDNVPVENIIALYEAFYEKGVALYEENIRKSSDF